MQNPEARKPENQEVRTRLIKRDLYVNQRMERRGNGRIKIATASENVGNPA